MTIPVVENQAGDSCFSFGRNVIVLINKDAFYILCVIVFEATVIRCTDGGLAQGPCESSRQVGWNVHRDL